MSQLMTEATAIRELRVGFSDADLDDLGRRIEATRWPERETVDDDSQGVPLALMQDPRSLLGERLRLAQVRGQARRPAELRHRDRRPRIHFIHVRSRHEDALPLIVTHGWPGSIIEQLKIIEPLTDPTAHGASAEDAFQS
jgi:hypothetical protein